MDTQHERDDGKAPPTPADSGIAEAAGAASAEDQAKGDIDKPFLRRLQSVTGKPKT
jgi:hypothetical protein